jgi:hypothetical protein
MPKKRGEAGLIKVAEATAMKTVARKFAPPTRAQLDLLDAAERIRNELLTDADRGYITRQLILCTFPHSDPGDVPIWTRRNSNLILGIEPGRNLKTHQSFGYPWGSIPRLLLYWICTEVQRSKNVTELTEREKRTLQLGHSLAAFMHAVGLNPANGSGKKSDRARLLQQMTRLFRAKITFEDAGAGERGEVWRDMTVAPDGDLWWTAKEDPNQQQLFPSWILLGERFYDALLSFPVPIDTRALKALKQSPLALDLYAWVCYAAFAIIQKQRPPQFVAWVHLSKALGAEYGDPDDFKKKARKALRKAATVYDGLTIGRARGGFTIHATRLAVPQKTTPKLIG